MAALLKAFKSSGEKNPCQSDFQTFNDFFLPSVVKCAQYKSLCAIKEWGLWGEHAAHQAWTREKDFKPWVLLRYISELFLLKDNKCIVSFSSPSTGTLSYSLLLSSKTLQIHRVLKDHC